MTENQNIPWKRISVEASAIVASILLAFAIDAWWEERLVRSEEVGALERLKTEFEDIVEQIDEAYAAGLPAARQVFERVSQSLDADEKTVDIPKVTLSQMTVSTTYEAVTPVLDGLVRSGRLEIIRDLKVVSALAHWSQRYGDYDELARRTRRNLDSNLLPGLRRRADIGDMMMANRGPRDLGQTAPDPQDVIVITVDAELKGLVAERWENGRITVALLDQSRRVAEEVVLAIDLDN